MARKKTAARKQSTAPGQLNVSGAAREVCLGLPETEEVISHGSPDFRVAGKTFATYTVNHHGDGHVALWLRSPPGAQQLYTDMEPEFYFIPPYVGPKGWLGLELNTGINWSTVAQRVQEAYIEVAPAKLSATLGDPTAPSGTVTPLTPEEIDPYLRPRALEVVTELQQRCLQLPETHATTLFGAPAWKAGKKTFCSTHHKAGRLQLSFWVGHDEQQLLSLDPRFTIPAFTGHNGWIELDVEEDVSWTQVQDLMIASYRHFALKRMLKALEADH